MDLHSIHAAIYNRAAERGAGVNFPRATSLQDSGVASGYSKYSLNTLQFSEKIIICIIMIIIVIEMANVVVFQPFSPSNINIVNCCEI